LLKKQQRHSPLVKETTTTLTVAERTTTTLTVAEGDDGDAGAGWGDVKLTDHVRHKAG